MDNVAASISGVERGKARPRRKIIRRLLWLLAAGLGLAIAALGFWPAPSGFHGDESTAGAGAGHGGLERPFPALLVPAGNET
ncbi:MAG TPA: hypothetical protein VJX67_06075, partial [Blastocatellia bacterium]|nr:hypothetical protein [Blastocatellia bacterium]